MQQRGQDDEQPQFGQQYHAQQPPKRRIGKGCGIGCAGVFVLFVAVVIAAVASGGKSANTASTGSNSQTIVASDSPSAQDPWSTLTPGQGINWATSAAPTKAQPTDKVVFSCTSTHGRESVDITYGPDGSDYSASHTPFSKTLTLDQSAQYYTVTAQLQGSGNVSCSTTVYWDGDSTVKKAQASGGYNIAMAEVCSTFDGGWDAC